MVCILIELTQVFTESILVLKLQRKGLEVPFFLYWIALWLGHYGLLRRHIQSNLHQISFRSVHWINLRLLSSKIVSSSAGVLHNVHNFAGPMQKTHRVIYFQLGDVTQYLILWHIPETDFMYDKTNVATFPILHHFSFIRILFVRITRLKIA